MQVFGREVDEGLCRQPAGSSIDERALLSAFDQDAALRCTARYPSAVTADEESAGSTDRRSTTSKGANQSVRSARLPAAQQNYWVVRMRPRR